MNAPRTVSELAPAALITCTRLTRGKTRMMSSRCVRRWRIANGKEAGDTPLDTEQIRHSACRRCPEGQARNDGGTATARLGKPVKRSALRVCELDGCTVEFVPSTRRHKFHNHECAQKDAARKFTAKQKAGRSSRGAPTATAPPPRPTRSTVPTTIMPPPMLVRRTPRPTLSAQPGAPVAHATPAAAPYTARFGNVTVECRTLDELAALLQRFQPDHERNAPT